MTTSLSAVSVSSGSKNSLVHKKRTPSKVPIDHLSHDMQRNIVNFLNRKEMALVHLVRRAWRELLRSDGHLDLRGLSVAQMRDMIEGYMKKIAGLFQLI